MDRPTSDHPEPRPASTPGHRLLLVWFSLPFLMKAGLIVTAGGFAIDLLYHLSTGTHGSLQTPCCGPGFIGHVITLAGMVITFAGIFTPLMRRKGGK